MVIDYFKRFLIAVIIAICIGILFISGTATYAEHSNEVDNHTIFEDRMWPIEGEMTDTYGTRGGNHHGIDIAAPEGTPIYSVEDGTVTKSYYSDTYGNVVFIEHPSGYETVYAHMQERQVNEGEVVGVGEKIGTVGNTGRSSGSHLHFEVHNGNWDVDKTNSIDPLLVLADRVEQPDSLVASVEEHTDMEKEDEPSFAEIEQSIVVMKVAEDMFLDPIKRIEAQKGLLTTRTDSSDEKIELDVETGDTLWEIAHQHKVSIDELKEWNNLDSEVIGVGDTLTIYSHERKRYIVKQGDTLSTIAKDVGVSVDELRELNDLKHDQIFPGDTLDVERMK
ncbi:M23 family metallopeptidase [Desertibacillus haloalkaliphilus]|uniref:M23 family metallopeptidase n=1 Tax=Desertibacillus haloalkaliphilus TaxID=1328930 RepID=UPI001C274B40|nr:M23 family metallopeptidase [Desertibacillus haloalkaliphilus]MBU8907192.1 peptidoglycan DD-metalloendopeptidase family protein [Desertibacillus haloalkaliphilus]